MHDFTLQELQCFDAVVTHGGFEAAARALHRSHPAVFAAVAKLERQLDMATGHQRVFVETGVGAGGARLVFVQKCSARARGQAGLFDMTDVLGARPART